tara:strand:- start:1376 stop:1519 length:144 start_codon:yes stop_codon:yes gene_type:complete
MQSLRVTLLVTIPKALQQLQLGSKQVKLLKAPTQLPLVEPLVTLTKG